MVHIESFPKITICLNSIHSKAKVLEQYGEEVNSDLTFLYGFYGDNHGEDFTAFWQKFAQSSTSELYLDTINLLDMLKATRSNLEILSCKFMNQGCKDEWVDIVTVYGV